MTRGLKPAIDRGRLWLHESVSEADAIRRPICSADDTGIRDRAEFLFRNGDPLQTLRPKMPFTILGGSSRTGVWRCGGDVVSSKPRPLKRAQRMKLRAPGHER